MSISPASIRGCGMLVIALGAVACGGDPESADAGAEAEMETDYLFTDLPSTGGAP